MMDMVLDAFGVGVGNEEEKVVDKMGISWILYTDTDLITRAKMIFYLFVFFFSLFDFPHLIFFFDDLSLLIG